MFYIIENLEQFEQFRRYNNQEVFMEIIPFSYNIHPSQNGISLIYLRPYESSKGYMICLDHSETFSLDLDLVTSYISSIPKIYVRDKKETLHYFPLKQLWDINLSFTTVELPLTASHHIFYKKVEYYPEINKLIPVSKHYESCEQLYDLLKDNIKSTSTKYEQFFNDKVAMSFNAIERNGIRIQPEVFKQFFNHNDDEYVFTQFNLKTTTTRPSNKWGGVNYAALNKENGCRSSFIPRNDSLIEIDISAYHPSLTAALIGYSFPTEDIHGHFAELYGTSYEEAKTITFRQLYGGVYKQYKHIEFFAKVEKYVEELWEKFNSNGFIECPVSHFIFRKDELENMNPQKLLNYLLQNLETSLNVLILWDILKILRGKETKLVLYTFDSFLLDYSDDEEDIIEEIKQVFSNYNLNTKTKQGLNYGF